MPSNGLSLVGFMDQLQAVQHLRTTCMPIDPSDAALIAEWNVAQQKIQEPTQNAGNPSIQPIPASHAGYIQKLAAQPWVAPVLAHFSNASFVMAEIDPLLAFQFVVDTDRAAHHCAGLDNPPGIDQLLEICLPITPKPEEIQQQILPQSAVIKSRCLNLQMADRGIFLQQGFMGFAFQMSLPLAHVVRLNGRHYLHNGFHRAYGVRKAGATHMPCLMRDVPDQQTAGIGQPQGTFQLPLLESKNPPTLAHFINGMAHAVRLRAASRTLHVSWADYVMPDE